MYVHENTDIDYISVQSNIKIKKTHITNKIVEEPVDKETPRQAIMIIREFIWVASSPHRVCSVSGVRE